MLSGTNANPEASETLVIKSYDSVSGVVEVEDPVRHYHHGASRSTAKDFGGLDMRSDLLLLSRDITIEADTTINRSLNELWGCRILVTDFYEVDGGYKKGSLNMENVAVHNCSQSGTDNPAIHFDTATGGNNSIKNSTFHSGKGQAIVVNYSKNVDMQDNIIHDFLFYGPSLDYVDLENPFQPTRHVNPFCPPPP